MELAAGRVEKGPVDVELLVEAGTVPEAAGGDLVADARGVDDTPGYVVTRNGAQWTVTFPGVASATCSPADPTVHVVTDPVAERSLLSVLLSGPLMATVAMNRGHTVLHSSAVWWDRDPAAGSVVALLGPKGAGKSSIAEALAASRGALLSDDALRVDATLPPRAHRGTTRSRVRSSADAARDGSTQVSADGRRLVDAAKAAPPTGPLTALLYPVLSREVADAYVVRLGVPAAVAVLASSSPIGELRAPDLLSERLRWAARFLETGAVHALAVPWGPGRWRPEDREALAAVVDEWLTAHAVA